MLKEHIGIIVKFLIIGFLFLILNIWIASLYIDATYRFNNELKKNIGLKKLNQKLKAEVTMLSAPQRIISIGKKKLNLHFIKNNEVIIVNNNE